MTKPRGGQPGNQNALKYGFYSKRFRTIEVSDLATLKEGGDLESEIDMLRVLARRLLDKAETIEDVDRLIKIVSTLGATSMRISALAKVQQTLRSSGQSPAEAISQAIDEVARELNLRQR